MSVEVQSKTTYKCPVCGGMMHCKSGGRKFFSFVCEICDALLMVAIRKPLYKVTIGGEQVCIDNEEVAKILNKE